MGLCWGNREREMEKERGRKSEMEKERGRERGRERKGKWEIK